MKTPPSVRHATIAALALWVVHIGCGTGGTSGNSLPATSGTGGSTNGNGGTSDSVGSGGVPGDNGGGGGGTIDAASVTGTGGAAGSGSPVGPLFEQFSPPGSTSNGATYSSNGVLISSSYYFYVKNTGGAGAATFTVSYQGYAETNNFTVEGGAQYVLASQLTWGNGSSTSCVLSADLPGLTLQRNFAGTDALASNFGKCTKVAGQSVSALIPLLSCTCSGGCPAFGACANNCGFTDEQCCGGCPSGKTCQSGYCL